MLNTQVLKVNFRNSDYIVDALNQLNGYGMQSFNKELKVPYFIQQPDQEVRSLTETFVTRVTTDYVIDQSDPEKDEGIIVPKSKYYDAQKHHSWYDMRFSLQKLCLGLVHDKGYYSDSKSTT